ncbi:hypothetical protein VTJ49DRAFT_3471 [Mycothermus thermophilus]|uniref:Uncharacterized protein n=1 Tax=Humicola insolens TaxID=85995 RepID=A0ABR3VM90_HUMIN
MDRPAAVPLSAVTTATDSIRKPSMASSQLDPLISTGGPATDCRTRSNNYQLALRKQLLAKQSSSDGTPDETPRLQGMSASILEHRRITSAAEAGSKNITSMIYPSSFKEIEVWLEGHVMQALDAAGAVPLDGAKGTTSSAIYMLFLDEKKCAKVFGQDFAWNTLIPRLRVTNWCTSHYQTTFCRYPLPLDADCDDETVQPVWNFRYSLSHPFDWDLLWAYFPSTRTTVAIVRTWLDGYDSVFTHLEHEIKFFEGPTLAHPMLFGLLALQVLTSDAMSDVAEKGNVIYEAQTLTGFHQYRHLRAIDSDGHTVSFDLGGVSRRVIGAASRITGWDNATLEMVRFGDFIKTENERYLESNFLTGQGRSGRAIKRLCVYVKEQAEKVIGDIRGAHHDSRAWLATANFLLMGVLNVLGHEDSQINIELAKDQKRIAEETKRDSTSMTAIALVTMFFLPGTFTASFFALPYFENDFEEYGLRHFWIYWVVTIPLTCLTLLVWTCYTKIFNPVVTLQEGDGDALERKKRNASITEWLNKTRSRSEAEAMA